MAKHPEGLNWTVRGERTLYDNRWIKLSLVDVEPPNGQRFESHVVRLNHVAIALIVDRDERVLTLYRYRFATDDWGYELLGGIVEPDEDPSVTVGDPERLLGFQPFPGMVDARIEVFLWREAEKVGEPTDTEEAGRIEWIPVDRAVELARNDELLGSGTLVPLLFYLASRGSG